jgi:hypothetical protein
MASINFHAWLLYTRLPKLLNFKIYVLPTLDI